MPIKQLKPISSPKADFWRKTQKKPKNKKKLLQKILLFSLFLASIAILVIFIFIARLSSNLPEPNQLIDREVAQSTKIYDRSGEHLLYEIHGEEKRTLISLDDIPEQIKQATISIEDKNFYKHGGFSIWAMFRTAVTNVLYNRRAGGSTLTQQFVKNAILSSEKSYVRKIKEIILAQRIEKKFSKDEILQMYLNEIPYGSNAYGVEAASQKFFAKSVKDINVAEAALLAALPQAPSRYSPYGPNLDLLLGRKDYILDLMAEQGYITNSEKEAAKSYEIKFTKQETSIFAPHFVMMVRSLLSEKYGEIEMERSGFKIYTTIDWDKQNIAEEVIKEKTENYQEKYSANNAALVAIDPKTGQVLAMVGSRDYFDDSIDGQVNVTDRPRQPGSSMKPLVYASLFEQGYKTTTKLYDVVTNFSTDSGASYTPKNYNGKELGPVSIRQALAGSLNIPAVKAIYLAGINQVLNLAENMGYSTLSDRSRFGLSLVLGGGEVKMLEHVNAFSAFAREGETHNLSFILKVEDKNGKVIEEYQNKNKRVLSALSARMINDILSDNGARAYIFGEKNWLTLSDRPVAAKTGTTNDFKDAWTIGYTPSLVAGVWIGNTNSSEMSRGADGSIVAAPIWNEFMKRSLTGTPVEGFNKLEEQKSGKAAIDGDIEYVKKIIIDKETGLIATDATPEDLKEEIKIFNHKSILFYVDKNDPLGPEPKNPENDPQYNAWENAIQRWSKENNQESNEDLLNKINLIKPENKPIITIISPEEGELINTNTLNVKIKVEAPREISSIRYQINENRLPGLGSDELIDISLIDLENGYQKLGILACDDVGNCENKTVNFNLSR
ncbi:MAG: PBP1A family penicillin-binding protein [Tissierellia bacterium]|nr:PBP1A family penicillin-binding protein [Tissierellia bacterium]